MKAFVRRNSWTQLTVGFLSIKRLRSRNYITLLLLTMRQRESECTTIFVYFCKLFKNRAVLVTDLAHALSWQWTELGTELTDDIFGLELGFNVIQQPQRNGLSSTMTFEQDLAVRRSRGTRPIRRSSWRHVDAIHPLWGARHAPLYLSTGVESRSFVVCRTYQARKKRHFRSGYESRTNWNGRPFMEQVALREEKKTATCVTSTHVSRLLPRC